MNACPRCQSPLSCWPVPTMAHGKPIPGTFAGVQVDCSNLMCKWRAPILSRYALIDAGVAAFRRLERESDNPDRPSRFEATFRGDRS